MARATKKPAAKAPKVNPEKALAAIKWQQRVVDSNKRKLESMRSDVKNQKEVYDASLERLQKMCEDAGQGELFE